MKILKSLLVVAIAAAFTVGGTPAKAQSGNIQNIMGGCPAPGSSQLGTASIAWATSSDAPDNITIWVQVAHSNVAPPDWGSPTLFAASRSGVSDATWLQSGFAYLFKLYDSSAPSPSYAPGTFLNSYTIKCN